MLIRVVVFSIVEAEVVLCLEKSMFIYSVLLLAAEFRSHTAFLGPSDSLILPASIVSGVWRSRCLNLAFVVLTGCLGLGSEELETNRSGSL